MVKKMFRFRGVEVLLLVLAWWLAACSAAPTATTPTALPTAAVEQRTAIPSVTPTATSTPTASPTVPCWAVQVAEPAEIVAQAPVGAAVEVAWQVTNTGACPWEPPLTLVALEGSDLDAPPWESTQTVPPGGTLEVRVALQAPATPGAYTALWALRPAHAEPVPQTLTLHLEALPPTPTPTPTPGPPVFVQRQIDVVPGKVINFDDGYGDVAYNFNGFEDQGLGHTGVVFFTPIYYWPPDFADCYHANYTKKNAILNPQYQVGQAFCYITNEQRVGALRIDGYYVDAQSTPHLVLTYITWNAKRK